VDRNRIGPSNPFVPFPKEEIEGSVPARFGRIVREHGGRLAIRTDAGSLTYRELDEAANRSAREIIARTGTGAQPVVLFLPTGTALFAAMLGALKAGTFYIPLDPALGDGRNAALLRETGARLLLCDRSSAELAHRVAPAGTSILPVEEIAPGPADEPGVAVSPDDAAYVLFTSGSTGEPKGVVQSHRNVLHNILKLTNGLHIQPSDRLTLLYSCSFGASVSDVYGALLNGAALLPFGVRARSVRQLADWLLEEELTLFHSVPGIFRQLVAALDGSERFSALRALKLGGEPVLASDFELYRRHFPSTCLFHVGLGATEMNVIRQWFANHDTVLTGLVAPLGYEVDETEVVLLDDEGRPAVGDTGEIAVVARTLPIGYWRRPDLTATAFSPVPGRDGVRLYRTGDLGRLLPDGCLLHLGRKDHQVKVRGYRIEPAEVEAALARLPGVREAAVAARQTPRGNQLVAWVVPRGPGRPDIAGLRGALKKLLPSYMVPGVFVFQETLPRIPNGKVDRGSLPDPGRVRRDLDTPYVAPRDDAEQRVAGIFAEVLGLERVGALDDFFDLGGSSFDVQEAILLLEEAFGREPDTADLLAAPTPCALAARMTGPAPGTGSLLLPLRSGNHPPVFFVPAPHGASSALLARLARRVPRGRPFLLFHPGETGGNVVETALEAIRTAQPGGPYAVLGECAGGILAWEIARRLSAAGERIDLLALLDTPWPRDPRRRLRSRFGWLLPPGGDYLLRRARTHVRALRSLPAAQWPTYLRGKGRAALAALREARRPEARESLDRRAWYAGGVSAITLEPWSGHLRFIQSADPRHERDPEGWATLAGSIEVLRVPGDHTTFLSEHVDEVGAILGRWLDIRA
jgi:amino acid adenylation domain-containing protein